jgi:hypothetical protein
LANSDKTKYYWSYLLALGQIPNPFGTHREFEMFIKTQLIEVSGTLDPELPDGYLSLILPVLKSNGWSDSKIKDFAKWVFQEYANNNPSQNVGATVTSGSQGEYGGQSYSTTSTPKTGNNLLNQAITIGQEVVTTPWNVFADTTNNVLSFLGLGSGNELPTFKF